MARLTRSSSPLSIAVEQSNLAMVKFQLVMGENPNEILSTGTNPFFMAIKSANLEIVKAILSHNQGIKSSKVDLDFEINGDNAGGYISGLLAQTSLITNPEHYNYKKYQDISNEIHHVLPLCKSKISGQTTLSLTLKSYLTSDTKEQQDKFESYLDKINEFSDHKCLENHLYYDGIPILDAAVMLYIYFNEDIFSFRVLKKILKHARLDDLEKKFITGDGGEDYIINIAIRQNKHQLLEYLLKAGVSGKSGDNIWSDYLTLAILQNQQKSSITNLDIIRTLVEYTKGQYTESILSTLETQFINGDKVVEILKSSPNYQELEIEDSINNKALITENEDDNIALEVAELYSPQTFIITMGDCEQEGCYAYKIEF
jgi:hypothetical protein